MAILAGSDYGLEGQLVSQTNTIRMEDLTKFLEAGSKMGLSGKDLLAFVEKKGKLQSERMLKKKK